MSNLKQSIKNATLAVRIERELVRKFKAQLALDGINISDWLRGQINCYLNNSSKNNKKINTQRV
jgi:hypothetical protein